MAADYGPTLAFFTRDRPGECAEAVGSFARVVGEWSGQPRLSVFDDSTSAESREALRSSLSQIAGNCAVAIDYAGYEEKYEFLGRLCGALDTAQTRAAAQFALVPEWPGLTTGSNCNALALHHVGRPALMLADDQRALLTRLGSGAPQVTDQSDGTVFWRFPSRGEVLAARTPEPVDLWSEHRALHALTIEGLDARVRLSQTGFWGDCAMSSPLYLWMCRLANAADVVASYPAMRWSREVVRGAVAPTISTAIAPVVMSSGSVVDFGSLCPPFPPVGRGQDGVFAVTLAACDERAAVAWAPIAMQHVPTSRPFDERERERTAGPPRLSDLLSLVILEVGAELESVDVEGRMQEIGARLQILASAKSGVTRALARLGSARQEFADSLREMSQYSAQPKAWRDDVEAFAAGLAASASREWERLEDATLAQAATVVREFGTLCQSWPAIWARASELGPVAKPL